MNGTNPVMPVLAEWLESCKEKGKIHRSTVAMGIVVLDHLRRSCPVDKSAVISNRGEVTGSRIPSLGRLLVKYGIPEDKTYLKEVTTRQGHQDGQRLFAAFDWGRTLGELDAETRDAYLLEAIRSLILLAMQWLSKQHLKVNCDRQLSPAAWIGSLLEQAKDRSGGKVEQHLVGAKLATRHPEVTVENFPGHAGDAQTRRPGDFNVGSTCYHVTASPGGDVIRKCGDNLREGLHPLLLVPRDQVDRARIIAEDQEIADRLTIVAIEDFIALNIIEMSVGDQRQFLDKLKEIVTSYNQRLEAVETDLSLKIELR